MAVAAKSDFLYPNQTGLNDHTFQPEFQMITSSHFYSLSNVWIDLPLMPSSDVTTQKTGSDFDWLIVQAFA